MSTKRDYYEILGINKSADSSEIKRAFRKLAMKYHPDRNKEADAEDKFKEINEAYEVLSDETKRKQYDQFGHAAFEQGGGASGFGGFNNGDFSDIFSDMFGGMFGGGSRRHNGPTQGENYQASVSIDFISAILGKSITRTLPKYEICSHCTGTGAESYSDIHTCSTCNGSGSVVQPIRTPFGMANSSVACNACSGQGKTISNKCSNCSGEKIIVEKKEIEIDIPAGINDGQNIVVEGFGGPGENGGPSGDLYLVVSISQHKYFTRENNDIFLDVPVSVVDIIEGNYVKVPTPYGIEEVKVSYKIASGTQLVLSGKGAPSVSRGKKGDLIITINIFVPKTNTKETKELLKTFKKVKDKKHQKWLKEFK